MLGLNATKEKGHPSLCMEFTIKAHRHNKIVLRGSKKGVIQTSFAQVNFLLQQDVEIASDCSDLNRMNKSKRK